MKKLLMVLTFVLMTLAACVALDGDTLKITAKVPQVKPEFTMVGTFNSDYKTDVKTAAKTISETNTLDSDVDISESPVSVYITITQSNTAKYKNKFNLTVTATDLKMEGNDTDVAPVSATSATYVPPTADGMADRISVTPSASGKVATFAMDYTNGKPVSGFSLRSVFTWAANENLPVGNYSATITLGYTAP